MDGSMIELPTKEILIDQLAGIPIQLPLFVCMNGHYSTEKKKCTQCRAKVIKCDFLEDLIRQSKFRCPHEGCGEGKSGAEFQMHVDNQCHYRPMRCPFFGCTTLIPFWFYFEHLTSRHHINGDSDQFSPSMQIPLLNTPDPQFGLHYKKWEDKLFFIRTFTSMHECIFWVELFGERLAEKDYLVTVRMNGKRGHKLITRFPVSPVRTDLEILNKTLACCHLSGRSMKQYFLGYNTSPTLITFTIQFFLEEDNLEETLC